MFNKKINNIEKRNAKERRFKACGQLAILFVLVFLSLLFSLIFYRASKAINRYEVALEIDLTSYSKQTNLKEINFGKLIQNSLKSKFSEVQNLKEENWLYQILSRSADHELKKQIKNNRYYLGEKNIFWLPISSKAEMFFKYKNSNNLNEAQLNWLANFEGEKQIRRVFNRQFFYQADSREPEIAGIGAGLVGSLMVMFIFLILAFPIAVSCAFYLEEFAKKNRFTDLIEISINNLAAIPSIIYGLLGLVLYLQIMHLPRSSSLVGGMTLFMLVLPVIIIATRNTIRSIPQNIRDGAYGLGASKLQVTARTP